MSSFFKKLAKATPGLTQGFVTGMKLRQDGQKLEDERIKRLADEYASGLSRTEDGSVTVNPEFNNPESELYKYVQRQAELKKSGTPTLTFGDVSSIKDGTAAPGLKLPANVAQGVLNPKPLATPEQIAAYEQEFGGGTGANLTPAQIAGARSRQMGLMSAEERSARDRELRKKAIEENIALRRDSQSNLQADREERRSMARDAKLQAQREKLSKDIKDSAGEPIIRAMGELDSATKIFSDPDNAAYGKLPAKSAMLGSWMSENIGGAAAALGGSARELQLINQITGPILRSQAGLAQTVSEAARVKIQMGLNTGNPKLLAEGLRDARKDMSAAVDRMGKTYDPSVVSELMGPGSTMDYSGLLPIQKLKPSDARAAYAKGEPVSEAAKKSGQKFGMGEDKLADIRKFPTKGKVVKKQHNKAANKTKLIYDNGEEVIVDGLK